MLLARTSVWQELRRWADAEKGHVGFVKLKLLDQMHRGAERTYQKLVVESSPCHMNHRAQGQSGAEHIGTPQVV